MQPAIASPLPTCILAKNDDTKYASTMTFIRLQRRKAMGNSHHARISTGNWKHGLSWVSTYILGTFWPETVVVLFVGG